MNPNKKQIEKSIGSDTAHISLPYWLVVFYTLAGITLLPWTIYISASLPVRHVSHHWDLTWGGFDVFVSILLLLTAYLIHRRSLWVSVTASALSASLLIDGWFDILSARAGVSQRQSILLFIAVELPVACVSLYAAAHIIQQEVKEIQNM